MHRSALVAWRANATIGNHQFKWILYGDDDTLFAIDNVLAMVNRFDHNQPYFLADNIWFPEWDGTPALPFSGFRVQGWSRWYGSIPEPSTLGHPPSASLF